MGEVERMFERYFTLRNQQLELLKRGRADVNLVDALYEKAATVLEKADAMIENVQPFSDVGTDAEVYLLESSDWISHELTKPVRVDTTVKKLLAGAGIPDLVKLQALMQEYVQLYNEQVEALNRVAKVYADANAIYEKADEIVGESQDMLDVIEKLELEVLYDSQIEDYLGDDPPDLKVTDARATAKRALALFDEAEDEADEEDDEEE